MTEPEPEPPPPTEQPATLEADPRLEKFAALIAISQMHLNRNDDHLVLIPLEDDLVCIGGVDLITRIALLSNALAGSYAAMGMLPLAHTIHTIHENFAELAQQIATVQQANMN